MATPSHVNLYGNGKGENEEVNELVKRFASRAFRRPVSNHEIEPFLAFIKSEKLSPNHSPDEGIKDMKYVVFEGEWSKLPNFEKLDPVKQGEAKLGLIDLSHSPKKKSLELFIQGRFKHQLMVSIYLKWHLMMEPESLWIKKGF